MERSRRAVLGGLAGASTALAGCTGLLGGDGNDGSPGGGETSGGGSPSPAPLESAAAKAPVPGNAGDRTYATMGTGGKAVTYFGNWKCPYCAEFAVGSSQVLSLSTIVSEYVQPGDVQLTYRGLAYAEGEPFLGPDAPRATRAGLSVWAREPESYWPYHEYVMANQPSEEETWATTDRLVTLAEEANVSATEGLRADIENGKYEQAVRANTQAFNDAGAQGTPNLVIGDSVYNPFEAEKTRSALDEYVG